MAYGLVFQLSDQYPYFWFQSVQVMGSFDGWSHGEYLSAEYTGSYTRFSTSVMLRPGRYASSITNNMTITTN